MDSRYLIKQLLLTIQEDRKRYIRLEKYLIKQKEYMLTYQASDLIDLNKHMNKIYEELQNSNLERLKLFEQLKIEPKKNDINIFFSKLPENYRAYVNALWLDLEKRAKNCQKINQYNNQLLHMQQKLLMSSLKKQEEFFYTE